MKTESGNQSEELLKALEGSEQHIKDLINTEGNRINGRIDDINQRIDTQNAWIGAVLTIVLGIAGGTFFANYVNVKNTTEEAINKFKKDSGNELNITRTRLDDFITEAGSNIENSKKAIDISKEEIDNQAEAIRILNDEAKLNFQQIESRARKSFFNPKSIMEISSLRNLYFTKEEKTKIFNHIEKKNLTTKKEDAYDFDDWRELGLIDFISEKFDKAYEKFENALKVTDKNSDNTKIASTYIFKAAAYSRNRPNEYTKLVEFYDDLLKRFDTVPTYQQLNFYLVQAMFLKGYYLGRSEEYENAQKVYSDLIKKYSGEESIEIQKILADARFNAGRTYSRLHKRHNAIKSHQELIEYFKKSTDQYLRERVAMARTSIGFNLLVLGKASKNQKEREDYFNKSVLAGKWAAEWTLSQDRKNMILGNIGHAYFLLDEDEKARTWTIDAFYLGGKDRFCGQLKDVKELDDAIENKNEQYEKFIKEIWDDMEDDNIQCE